MFFHFFDSSFLLYISQIQRLTLALGLVATWKVSGVGTHLDQTLECTLIIR